jgi:hypothetical protein
MSYKTKKLKGKSTHFHQQNNELPKGGTIRFNVEQIFGRSVDARVVKGQVVGVSGGVIEPTEIDVELFRNAVEYKKTHIGMSESLAKMGFSKKKYNSAWKQAIISHNKTIDSKDLVEDGRR